ncbi:MAG: hypothetical protein M1817_005279 [Caeruleum heppii]|nr:MAG: hypothetical protein M1817_005279 [Caeruleum heppii]
MSHSLETNVTAWQSALANGAREGLIPAASGSSDLLTLATGDELLAALQHKEWGRPLALGTVINDAVARKQMYPLDRFLSSTESIYHSSWVIAPWQVLFWGLDQLGLRSGAQGEDKPSVGRFVLVPNVEICAKRVLAAVSGVDGVDLIFSKKLFCLTFGQSMHTRHSLTETDFNVLLQFLARDKHEIAYDGQTIKFRSPGKSVPHITSEDTTIASLKTLISDLDRQILSLNRRINSLARDARTAVNNKNRVAALSALRSKKLAESAMQQRADTLHQLEEVHERIRQAADQVELLRVMQGTTGVLKTLHQSTGGVDRVESVVEGLRQEMEQVEDIGNVINEAGQITAGQDSVEIDDELEIMERADREAREEAEARQTREKLNELKTPVRPPVSTLQADRKEQALEHELAKNAASLDRMSLDDARQSTDQSPSEAAEGRNSQTIPAS